MTGKRLFELALAQVESESIRAWAASEHNRPIFEQIAENAITRAASDGKPEPEPLRFATFIMYQAIGL